MVSNGDFIFPKSPSEGGNTLSVLTTASQPIMAFLTVSKSYGVPLTISASFTRTFEGSRAIPATLWPLLIASAATS